MRFTVSLKERSVVTETAARSADYLAVRRARAFVEGSHGFRERFEPVFMSGGSVLYRVREH